MTTETEERLRLTILGGFLGSGKTTWLRHQLHEQAFGRVHVIVNEAANAPVDDALLRRADQMTLLAGACVCCDGRDQLRRTLLDLCDARSAKAAPSARIAKHRARNKRPCRSCRHPVDDPGRSRSGPAYRRCRDCRGGRCAERARANAARGPEPQADRGRRPSYPHQDGYRGDAGHRATLRHFTPHRAGCGAIRSTVSAARPR